jgi:hypothetical protein
MSNWSSDASSFPLSAPMPLDPTIVGQDRNAAWGDDGLYGRCARPFAAELPGWPVRGLPDLSPRHGLPFSKETL